MAEVKHDDAVVAEMNTDGAVAAGLKCPIAHDRVAHPTQGGQNQEWWPRRLNLKILAKNPAVANPLGADFDYSKVYASADGADRFVDGFIAAWVKVMEADRFDLHR